MKRPIIAIDIDDVLSHNAAGFTAFSNATWGTTLTPEDYHEHYAELWGIDMVESNERILRYHREGVLGTYKHVDTALPVLKRLSKDYELRIVTSRRETTRPVTLAWIHEYFAGIFTDEKVHFAGIWDKGITTERLATTKASVIAELGADYLIDDQLKHCQGVAETGRRALLFGNYTWNKTDTLPSGVVRVDDWAAVEKYFYGEQ